MYIFDDICYTPASLEEIRVTAVQALQGGILLITFLSGELKLFDTTTLEGEVFLPLKDDRVFNTAKVNHGFVYWLDGEIDIAPKYLYEHSMPYNTDDVITAA